MDGPLADRVQKWLDALAGGDPKARDALVQVASERLHQLAHRMLRDYPTVGRWEDTDDVLQNATIRLYRSLGTVVPPTARDFFRFAAAQLRRELVDMARHYHGPLGMGRHHESWGGAGAGGDDSSNPAAARFDPAAESGSHDPSRLAAWTEFHDQVGRLEEDAREAFDLLFYQGLSQAEAAAMLGVSERTVKRRWQDARLALHDRLQGRMPGV